MTFAASVAQEWEWQPEADRAGGHLDRKKRWLTLHRLSVADEGDIEDSVITEVTGAADEEGERTTVRHFHQGANTIRILDCGTKALHNCSREFKRGDPESFKDFSGPERRSIANAITEREAVTEKEVE